MKIYRGLNDPSLKRKKRAIAIGIFDGLHLGHRKILERAVRSARKNGGVSMVITFDPHPEKILRPALKAPKILMSPAHRLRLFEIMGVDETCVIAFDKKFARIPHKDFLNKFLVERLGMQMLSVGADFCFGQGAKGDTAYLKKEARTSGYRFFAQPAVLYKGKAVSSTRIRSAIESGKLEEAARMLGRPVSVYGEVIRGRGRGKSIGFPTANLNPHHETLPPPGVYAAYGEVDGKRLKGVVHIGQRPTFGEKDPSLEVHFLNYHRSIYGRTVELFFVGRIRPTRKYASAAVLRKAILGDIQIARRLFS